MEFWVCVETSVLITGHYSQGRVVEGEAPELALASSGEGGGPGSVGACCNLQERVMRFLEDASQKENGLQDDEK